MPLAVAALLSLLAAAPPAAVDACIYDRAALLALTPDKFDQDIGGGWRPLADRPACRRAAAELLHDYREAHRPTLKAGDLHISYWHEGQIRAGLGESQAAVPLLLAGVNPQGSDSFDFADYAIGTVAFLQRDRPALQAARDRLAKLPEPAGWPATQARFRAKFGSSPAWPPNLNVLDGLLACFDQPYAQAYAPPCTGGGMKVVRPDPPRPSPPAGGR